MKKLLKRIIAFAFVAILFTAPSIAQAATIDYVEEYEGMKWIHYSPNDLLIINSGSTNRLANNVNDGNWYFQPGRSAQVVFELIMPADFNVTLYKVNSGPIATYNYEDCTIAGAAFEWCIEQSGNYMFIIEPLNGTAVIVDNFYVYY